MAVSADRVIVELEARIGRYRRDMELAEKAGAKSLGKIGSDAKKAERQILQSSTAISGSLRGLAGSYTRLLSVAGIGILAKEFIKLADANKQLEATLRLATTQFGSFGQAQKDVERIAADTRAGLNDTAKLYASFTRVAAEAGITQDQAARATETFAKSLKIGGANAQEASSATLQFNQALASGVLSGDEFKSINEASSRTTKLLADSLGITTGQLRKLAEQQKLTRDVLINALVNTKYTKGIDDEFRVLPVTVGDSLVLVQNAAQKTFGAFDRGGEFSAALASFFQDGAKGFGDLSVDAEQFGREARAVLEGLGDAFQPFIDAGKAAFVILGNDSASIGDQIRRDIRNIALAYDALNALGANTIGTARTNAVGDFDRRVAASQQKAAIVKGGDGLRALINSQNATFGTNRPARASVASGGGTNKKAKGSSGPSADQIANGQRNAADAISRAQVDLLEAEADLTTDTRILDEARRARIRNERDLAISDIQANKLATDGQKAEAILIENKIAEAKLRKINIDELQRQAEEQAQSAALQRDLKESELSLVTNREQRAKLELEIIDLKYQELDAALRAQLAQAEIAKDLEGQARINAQIAANAQKRADEREGSRRNNESPLQRFQREVGEVGNNINDQLEKVQVDGLNALNDGLVDAITGAKSLGDVFNDIANSIIKDLLRIAIQQAVIGPLTGGGKSGGGGGFFGELLGAIPGVIGGAFGGGGKLGSTKAGGSFFKDLGLTGKRASGGNVRGGGRYLLGENGPEIAEFAQSGKIYPTGSLKAKMGGGGTTVIAPQQFDLSGVVMTEDLVRMLDARNKAYADQVSQKAATGALRASPGYGERERRLRG